MSTSDRRPESKCQQEGCGKGKIALNRRTSGTQDQPGKGKTPMEVEMLEISKQQKGGEEPDGGR